MSGVTARGPGPVVVWKRRKGKKVKGVRLFRLRRRV
jgi:hypothetical protein